MSRFFSSTWTLGVIAFVLTWGGGSGVAELIPPNIDNSFHAGLQMAATKGLNFGPDILVTYGPLGFVKSNLVFEPWPARLAGLYGILLHLSLCLSLVWAARRNFSTPIAFGVALVTAVICRGDLTLIAVRDDASVVVLAFLWSIAALSEGAPSWTRKLLVYGGGPFAAIELLSKVNTGLIILGVVVIAALAVDQRRVRNTAIVLGSFLATALALWLATGQSLADIPTFLKGTVQVIQGYSSGARIDYGYDERQYDYPFAVILFGLVALAAFYSTKGLELKRKAATIVITVVVVFTTAKGGFISHEVFHMATFYGTMLGLLVAFPLPERPRLRYGALAATAAAAAMAFSTHFAGYVKTGNPDYPMINPIENVSNGAETLANLTTGRLEDEIEARRERLIDAYDLDAESLRLLQGHTVHLDPSEDAAIWAYDLDWKPLPIYQPYIAWTPELDRINADATADPEGPERILRQNLDALGQYSGWESPRAMIEMLCNFETLHATERWQVLGRVEDRCGPERLIDTTTVPFGTPVEIPEAPPGTIVFARVRGLEPHGLERIRDLLLRAHGRQARFSNSQQIWTLIAATGEDGLIMRAPRSIDFPRPYSLAPHSKEVTFLFEGGGSDQELTIDWYAMPVTPSQ